MINFFPFYRLLFISLYLFIYFSHANDHHSQIIIFLNVLIKPAWPRFHEWQRNNLIFYYKYSYVIEFRIPRYLRVPRDEENTKVRKKQSKMQLNRIDNGENVITHCDIFFIHQRSSLSLLASFRERYRYANTRFNSSSRVHDSVN